MRTVIILFLYKISVYVEMVNLECGYKQCPQTREGALNVHLIPHSHMDAGWVKTFDEYYYGTRNSVSAASVQLIYHSILSELLHDKRRKFTFSETGYFWRWWKEQRPATRMTFRSLVQAGRVEFAGGGWVNNDEATPDYLMLIDQYTWGLRKLNDTLGPCGKPKAAWQIDAYGHSREQASLFAQMGYDGVFIGRVDHKMREAMIQEERMEFMWRGSDALGKMSDIMTHTLYNLYNAPEGFCFDFLCSDEPVIDDPDSSLYNAEKRINELIAQIDRQAKYYEHDNIILTMGGDFTYQNAASWFMNMDKIINHVNSHPANLSDINIFYSTPSCYLKAVYLYGRRDKSMYTETKDHMPYGSDENTYWTGYYTSRPGIKLLARRAHAFLQVVKQLSVITKSGDSYELHLLRHATSLVLHHDAITGTSQQNIINDFIRTLTEAIDVCAKKVSNFLSYLTPSWGMNRRLKTTDHFLVCQQLNISICRFTDTDEPIQLLVYNPLSVKTFHYLRLPASALHYSIRDAYDEEVDYQLVPLPAAVINLPGRASSAIQELVFEVENLPPMGYVAFYITPITSHTTKEDAQLKLLRQNVEEENTPYISNEYLKVTLDKETGLLKTLQQIDGITLDFSQNFYTYNYHQAAPGGMPGAYSFRPQEEAQPITEKVVCHTIRGALVKEIRQRFTDWATQVVRLYRGEEFVEMEWIIGPVPIGPNLGRDVITVIKSNISNDGVFYTDSNARQMMKRKCSEGFDGKPRSVASCYYPITSQVCVNDVNGSVSMCVLTDRAQGVTARNGQIEIMLHRRLLTDDGFGLEEALNEEEFGVGLVVRGKHRIYFGNYKQEVNGLTFGERMSAAARRWRLQPWTFFTPVDKINRKKWQNVRNKRFSPLRNRGLPRHIHILTLEPWKSGSVLLRLENTLESSTRTLNTEQPYPDEYAKRPSYINVDLTKIFHYLKIKKVRETTLAANQWLDYARQMDWSTRYVYNGADEDIFPEDLPMDDSREKQYEVAEDEREEDLEDHHKFKYRVKSQAPMKRKPMFARHQHNEEYTERKKRSINFTDINGDAFDNAENEIFELKDQFNEPYFKPINNITLQSVTHKNFETTTKIDKPKLALTRESTVKPIVTTIKHKRKKLRGKISKEMNSDDEGDLVSYEDKVERVEILQNNKKKQTRFDDTDIDVTKSIYEMYFKRPKKLHGFDNYVMKRRRDFILNKRKNILKHRKQIKEEVEETSFLEKLNKKRKESINRRKEKIQSDYAVSRDSNKDFEMKFLDRKKQAKKDETQDFKVEEIQNEAKEQTDFQDQKPVPVIQNTKSFHDDTFYEENVDSEIPEMMSSQRWKRSPPTDPELETEPPEAEQQEYIITLRPTQIRTFIVWFENFRPEPKAP